jgi:hypothetical protein
MAACREVGAALDRYLDGEMNAAERAEYERHLTGCRECAGLLAERRTAGGMLAEWVRAEVVERSSAPVRTGTGWLRVAAAAAAVFLAGTIAWQHTDGVSVAPVPAPSGHKLVMRSMDRGVTVVPGKAGAPDELVVDAFPVELCWRSMTSGVQVVRGEAGQPQELIVDPFPVKMRSMSSGVVMVSGKAGEPVELVVDPFPEEGK